MAAALAGCADVLADVLVATAFRVMVVHPDVSHWGLAGCCAFLVVDALDMRARVLGEVCTLLRRALLPLVADSGAGLAAEGRLPEDVAELGAGALVDGAAHASGPAAPAGGVTVNRAGHSVASLLEALGTARLAAEDGLADNVAGGVAEATAAGLGALSPLGHRPHFAIDGAGSLAADLGAVKCGALLAEEVRLPDDVAFTVTHAATAGAGAGGPLAELGVDAVLGTRLGVALLGLLEERAHGITAALLGDATSTGHEASAALLRAFGVVAPAGHGALDRARAHVALAVLVEVDAAGELALLAAEGGNATHLARALLDTGAARDGAILPGGPMFHLAVDGALVVVADAGLAEGRARLAAVLRLGHDRTGAGLEAGVARAGAGSPLAEVGNFAVNLAREHRAGGGLAKSGALVAGATVLDDLTGAEPLAHAAGLRARAPRAELADLAVVGAVAEVALDILIEVGARLAAEGLVGNDGAGAGLGAVAAGDGAVRKRAPAGHLAIDGAFVVVTGGVLQKVGALLTTVHLGLAGDVALATFLAGAAGLGALGPRAEGSDATVDRAVLSLALLGLGEGRARHTFEPGGDTDLAGAGLLAGATRLGAAAPVRPLADDTVDGTRINVAFTGLFQPRAHAAGALVLDLARADLEAAAAGLVASAPLAPLGNDALDGTRAGIAYSRVLDGRARLATANHRLDDDAGAVFAALATFLVAKVEGRPAGDGAVDSARHGVALNSLAEGRADVAAVLGVAVDGAGAGLLAGATGLGAFGEGTPLGHFAVSWARTRVAGAGHEGVAALLAGVLGLSENLALAAHAAVAAGLVAGGPVFPSGELAVDGTLLGAALLGLGKDAARLAAVERGGDDHAVLGLGAAAAGGSAGGPGEELRELAVLRALVGVALASLLGGRALLAALALADNGTGVLLLAGAARSVAGRPGGPGGDLARDGALLLLAGTGFLDVGAWLAAAGGLDLHDAGAGLLTPAAGGRAGGPALEFGDLAVHRAGLSGALTGFVEDGALVAATLRLGDDGAGADLGAGATGLVAVGPFGELGDDAVERALVHGALLAFVEGRARGTTAGGLLEDGALAVLDTAATGGVAGAPLSEEGDLAIGRAGMDVARLGLGKVRADPFTLVGVADDLAHTGSGTDAARLRAVGPEAPVRNFAVESARALVAGVLLVGDGALPATKSGFLDDLAGARAVAATALLGALGPLGPLADDAVDWASVHVAGLGNLEVAAGDTAVSGFAEHGTTVDHVASTARLGALAERSPLGVLAVDGALVGVAGEGLGERRARLATAGRLLDDGTEPDLVALTAGLVAFAPGAPLGDGTVVRASKGVALDLNLEVGALVAAVGSLGDYFTGALHNATTAGLGAGGPLGPLGNVAVNGALAFVALAGLVEARAHSTAEGRVSPDGTLAGGPAGAAASTASRPGTPLADCTVDGTFFGVALGSLLEHAAGLAAEGSRVVDGTTALLLATTARVGAGGPVLPSGHLAVSGADASAADLGLLEGRAVHAVALLGDLAALADLVAGATGLVALGPLGPLCDLALDSARLLHALGRLEKSRALHATGSGGAKDRAGTVNEAGATGDGALGPVVERANLAIDGAGEAVARLFFIDLGAFLAAVRFLLEGSAPAVLGAVDLEGGAGLVARRPLGPLGHPAVDGAVLGVAVLHVLESRTDLAAGSLLEDSAGAGLGATVAGLGTFAEVTPGRNLAVLGADLLVAGVGLLEVGARLAAVGVVDLDSAVAHVEARAAGLAALVPLLPLVHDTVDRAGMHFAVFLLVDISAGLATVLGVLEHVAGAGALVLADAAGLSA